MSERFRGGGGGRAPIYPKPFRYIEIPGSSPQRRNPITHERVVNGSFSGELRGQIRTLGPVHIGSGRLELSRRLALSSKVQAEFPLVRGFVTREGKHILPGSSLKGAIRSVVEAISPSCVSKKGRYTNVNNDARECRKKDYLCPACRLFGAMGYLGKVKFEDGVQVGDAVAVMRLPQMYRPQTTNPDGRKFYMHGQQATGEQPVEVVPEGELFNFSFRFDNLQPAELGLLALALGLSSRQEESFCLKLGGFKPACLGSVKFEPQQLSLESGTASYLDFDAPEAEVLNGWEAIQPRLEPWLEAARNAQPALILRDRLLKVAETLRYPNDRICPPGLY